MSSNQNKKRYPYLAPGYTDRESNVHQDEAYAQDLLSPDDKDKYEANVRAQKLAAIKAIQAIQGINETDLNDKNIWSDVSDIYAVKSRVVPIVAPAYIWTVGDLGTNGRWFWDTRRFTYDEAINYYLAYASSWTFLGLGDQDVLYFSGKMPEAQQKLYLEGIANSKKYVDDAIASGKRIDVSRLEGPEYWYQGNDPYYRDNLSESENLWMWYTHRFNYQQAKAFFDQKLLQYKKEDDNKPPEEDCDDYLKDTGSWYNPASYITSPISSVKGITDYILCKLKKAGGGLIDVADAVINKIKEYFWDAVKFLEISAIVLGLIILGALGLITYFSWYTSPIRGAKVTYDYEIGQADKLAKQKGISRQEALKQVAARQIALGATNPAALVGETFINTLPEGAVDTSAIDAAIPAVM